MDRRKLTFAQAEGAAPLPRRLELREVSDQLRAVLASLFVQSVVIERKYAPSGYSYLGDVWENILRFHHVAYLNSFPSQFKTSTKEHVQNIEKLFRLGDYIKIFDFVQFFLRHPSYPRDLIDGVEEALEYCGAAYTIIDDPPTIVPATTEEEGEAIKAAADQLRESGFEGARSHLIRAAELINSLDWADSVRESIHAVESVARRLNRDASKTLGPALKALEKHGAINRAMYQAFDKLYGYTNTQEGIRHALLDESKADVGPAEATFMLGACAGFVSYLLARGRESGLLNE